MQQEPRLRRVVAVDGAKGSSWRMLAVDWGRGGKWTADLNLLAATGGGDRLPLFTFVYLLASLLASSTIFADSKCRFRQGRAC